MCVSEIFSALGYVLQAASGRVRFLRLCLAGSGSAPGPGRRRRDTYDTYLCGTLT